MATAIRIDEFRNYAASGAFTKADLTRYLTFGFDIDITGVIVLGKVFTAKAKDREFVGKLKGTVLIAPYRGLS